MVYLLTLLALAADRIGKWWVASYLATHGPIQVHDLLTLRASYNRGMVFGLLQGTGGWMGWISLAVIGGLFVYLVRMPKSARIVRVGLALVVGGALGNFIDRVLYGEVLDFIETPLLPWVFNLADIFINGGMLIFIAGSLLSHPDSDPDEIAPDNAPVP